MTKIKIVFCYQDLRTSGEDFVLTPFLFGVWNKKFRALGICLWWHARFYFQKLLLFIINV